jgi:hypothetical protein
MACSFTTAGGMLQYTLRPDPTIGLRLHRRDGVRAPWGLPYSRRFKMSLSFRLRVGSEGHPPDFKKAVKALALWFGGAASAVLVAHRDRLRGWPCRTRSAPGDRQGVGGASPLR